MDWTDVKVQNLTMAFPLKSRHVGDVANVLSAMYCKLRSLGLPLHRVHTDRAREFTGRQLAQWFRRRDVAHTTSAGDESQGCARVEAEIGYLKSRTRLLLGSAKVDTSLWPLALWHAGEQRFRSQMALLGIKLPQLVPFGTQAMARIKRWQHIQEKDKWEHPMQQITVFGPAHSMSPTSHGYYICCQGRWMRSTVVVRYANPLPEAPPGGAVCGNLDGEPRDEVDPGEHQDPEFPLFDVAENSEGKVSLDLFDVQELPAGSRPLPRRLHGKQTVPGLHAVRPEGEWAWDPLQLQLDGEAHGNRALCDGGAHGNRALCDEGAHGNRALCDGGAHGNRALCDGGAHGDRALRDGGAHGDRALQHGGAYGDRDLQDETTEDWKQIWRSLVTTVEDSFKIAALELLQLRELRSLEQEERALLDDEIGVQVPGQVRKECEKIEVKLRALQSVEELQEPDHATLVTKSISLEEVRRNINEWKPALEAEYRSLKDHKAICPINEEEYQRLRKEREVMESIPGMLVATLKPPSRKKARVVACGNHVQSGAERGDLSAGGIDTIAFRSLVSMATREGFSIGTADVKTAFLQAPRRSTPGRETIVQPPAILKEAGVLSYGWAERWKVTGALYGLVESPRDWADFRDGKLRQMSWRVHDGGRVQLRPTAESHLWKLVELPEREGEKEENIRAYLGVYVDDLVVAAKDDMLVNFMEQLKKVFLMSPYEVVTDKLPVTFCGYEITKKGGGFVLNQAKYTDDLLRRRNVQGYELQPLPKIEEGDDEPEKDIAVIREVQAIVGELQWLASRTRPDLAYATSLVARMVHRRPCYALRLCNYILKYLHKVPSLGLHYLPDDDVGTLHVKADTSFGPAHEQFRSVQGVALYHGSHLLLWSSSRQPFVTLSTAEGELVGYSEAFQCGMSLSELLLLFNYPTKKVLEGDSKAALCQITSDAGSWRTRHLRLRAWKLREMVMGGDSQWSAKHVPGGELVADGLSKSLQGAAHRKFLGLLGLDDGQRMVEDEVSGVALQKLERMEDRELLQQQVAPMLLGAGLALCAGSRHTEVGTMLIVCSLVVKWWEGRKNSQDSCKSNKSPKNDPLGNKKEKMKERDGPCRNQESDQEPHGPRRIRRKDQDPEGTRRILGDPLNPEHVFGKCLGVLPNGIEPKSSEEGVVRGVCPGLRAMRIEPKDGKGSGRKGAMEHGSAKARGLAAISTVGGSGGGVDQAPNYGASAAAATTDGQEVEGPFPAGRALFEDSTGLMNQGYPGRPREEQSEKERRKELMKRMQCLEERMDALALDNRNYMASHPMVTSKETERAASASGSGIPQVVMAGPPCASWTRPATSGAEGSHGSVWGLEQYQYCPTGHNRWDLSKLEVGWVIRIHGRGRKRRFHPLHQSLPVEAKELEGPRITKRFLRGGKADVCWDEWTGSNITDDNETWSGYTFLQVKKIEAAEGRGMASSTSMAMSPEGDSDGSFECVDE